MHHADVGPAGDLQAAAETDAVDRSDDGNRALAPSHGDFLELVRVSVRAFGQRLALAIGSSSKAGDVEPGTKATPLARQNHGTQALHGAQLFTGVDDGIEHRRVERVHLVGTVQPDLGNAVVGKLNRNAVAGHGTPQCFLSRACVPALSSPRCPAPHACHAQRP